MRYKRAKSLIEYAYTGVFYVEERVEPEDGNLIGDDAYDVPPNGDLLADTDDDSEPEPQPEPEPEPTVEEIILETKCDIQQSAKMFSNGAIISDYDVYFPREDNLAPLAIRNGMSFRCEDYPVSVQGMIVGIEAGQLGVKVQIKMPNV